MSFSNMREETMISAKCPLITFSVLKKLGNSLYLDSLSFRGYQKDEEKEQNPFLPILHRKV